MLLRRLLRPILFLGLSLATSTHAQELSPSAEIIGRIPFKLKAGFAIVVEGSIGTTTGLKFVLDTGATHTVIDRALARRLDLAGKPSRVFNFDKFVPSEKAQVFDVRLGPIHVPQASVLVTDLHKVSDLAERLDAIVGLDILALSEAMTIDFSQHSIEFRLSRNNIAKPGSAD